VLEEKRFQLVIHQGPQAGRVFPLHTVVVLIGREPSADVSINDPEVSRLHARLTATDDGYEIEDLGSTNGTAIDGRTVGRNTVPLSPGQTIKLGSSVILRYETQPTSDPGVTLLEDEAVALVEPGQLLKTAVSPNDLPFETEDNVIADPMLPPAFDDDLDDHLYDEQPALREMAETADELDELEPKLNALPPVATVRPASTPRVVPAREPITAPPPSGGNTTRRVINILLILLLLLMCCCCGFLVFMYQWGGDWLLREMGFLP
jgi:predicted component of type VI protein secretion system